MAISLERAIKNYTTPKTQRIWELDFLRGICLILMIFDHLMYNLATAFSFIRVTGFGSILTDFAYTYMLSSLRTVGWPLAVGVFVLLCGISTGLSRNNFLRGLRLLAVSYTITFTLTLVDTIFNTRMTINFGILHTLSYSILIYTLTTGGAKRINVYSHNGVKVTLQEIALTMLATVVIYLTVTYSIPLRSNSLFPTYSSITEVTFSQYYHFALGINRNLLLSTDYIPLLPWLGIFCIGCVLSTRLYQDKKSLIPTKSAINKWFPSKLGRRSLLIYIIHQPIIFILLGILSFVLTGRFI